MPTYDFECKKCNTEFERVFRMNDSKDADCPKCLGQAKRIYSTSMPHDFGFKPYWSDNLCREAGKQVYVESLAHKKALMKKFGLEELGRREGKTHANRLWFTAKGAKVV